ncbi:hypothetical protein [Polaromonas sp.]|uniref:DUF7281 domain-containing protein n=1 Tax=Polaromonas sp. TaxID=1869339 RepID=UPI00352B89DD
MSPSDVQFLRRLIADNALERRSGVISIQMVEKEGIGRLKGQTVAYTPLDLVKAENLLKSRGYGTVTSTGHTRSDAPPGGSEKYGALAVMADLVAVVPIGPGMDLIAPPNGFIAVPAQAAMDLPYEILLVCENLEPLLNIRQYHWLLEFINDRPTLALFRGKPQQFNTNAAARVIADTERLRPTLAFFDFDPKGLAMAASLPRREALCLPQWSELRPVVESAQRSNLFTQSLHACRAQLDKELDPEIALAWQRLKGLSLGLDQEGFPR